MWEGNTKSRIYDLNHKEHREKYRDLKELKYNTIVRFGELQQTNLMITNEKKNK